MEYRVAGQSGSPYIQLQLAAIWITNIATCIVARRNSKDNAQPARSQGGCHANHAIIGYLISLTVYEIVNTAEESE
jgi:hypothetical protein